VATGRGSDRFRKASGARTPDQHAARVKLVRRLFAEDHLDVLVALLDGAARWADVEAAGRKGDGTLAALSRTVRAKPLDTLIAEYHEQDGSASRWHRKTQLKAFAAWVRKTTGRAPTARDLSPEFCGKFLGGLQLAGSTRNRYRAALSGFARWALARRYIAAHPIRDKQVAAFPEPRHRIPNVPLEALGRYLAATHAHGVLGLALRTLALSGLDVGELARVRPADFAFTAHGVLYITTRRRKTRTAERSVPVAVPSLVADLKALVTGLTAAATPFPGVTDTWARGSTSRALWAAHAAARAAIPDEALTIKDLRHVAAQTWRRAGADLRQIQEWLGHATLGQSAVYAAFGADTRHDSPVAAKVGTLLDPEPAPAG
jgi:integrase